MRRLILLRHAKSSWADSGQTDHQRPLNTRGRHDAPLMAQRLVQCGWEPQWVLCSDAARTRETWQLMADTWSTSPTVSYSHSLYLGGLKPLSRELSTVPEDVQTVLAIGHNPGWEEATSWLSGIPTEMTTANAALLERDHEHWFDALRSPSSWRLCDVLRPKEH